MQTGHLGERAWELQQKQLSLIRTAQFLLSNQRGLLAPDCLDLLYHRLLPAPPPHSDDDNDDTNYKYYSLPFDAPTQTML